MNSKLTLTQAEVLKRQNRARKTMLLPWTKSPPCEECSASGTSRISLCFYASTCMLNLWIGSEAWGCNSTAKARRVLPAAQHGRYPGESWYFSILLPFFNSKLHATFVHIAKP